MLFIFIVIGGTVGLSIGNWIDWFSNTDGLKVWGIPILISAIIYACIWLFCSQTAITVAMIGAVAFIAISIIVNQFKG